MSFFDRLLGRDREQDRPAPNQRATWTEGPADSAPPAQQRPAPSSDQAAIDRYRYLLRTAPPETVEQAHAEAFAQLTPEQRRQVLSELSNALPPSERASSDDPRSLARMATRAEFRQPGTLERTLGPARQGPGLGTIIGGSLLGTIAGTFIGTAIAEQFFDDNPPEDQADDSGDSGDSGQDSGDGGQDSADAGDGGQDLADTGYDSGFDAGGFDGGGFDGGGFDGGDFGGF